MRVLIGVTGSIAAYKAAELVSELKKSGSEISVVMTEHATHLIGPATFRALSGGEVRVDLFERWPGRPIHIDLATKNTAICCATFREWNTRRCRVSEHSGVTNTS